MTTRRKFITDTSLISLAASLSFDVCQNDNSFISGNQSEVNWKKIRKCFPASRSKIANFDNGSAGVMPSKVLKAFIKATEEINSFSPYEIHSKWKNKSEKTFSRLSNHLGLPSGKLSHVRNTTEAINLVLWGLNFKKNDEVIFAGWDYPFVAFSLKHIRKQKRIKLNLINQNISNLSDDEILHLYEEKITSNTKLLIITWITHREGRILPVKKIADLAKKNNIEILIDGAHTIGHIKIDLKEINPDYFCTSLHKWFHAPLGNGLLYVNESKVNSLSPPISYDLKKQDNIVKFDYLGTRAFQSFQAIYEAIDFLELIGIDNKENRFHEMSRYWTNQVKDLPRLKFVTDPKNTCAINSFMIEDIPVNKIKATLKEKFNIHVKTSSLNYPNSVCIRVSPNIYNDFNELDRLVEGIHYVLT